jgi:betaine reductase
MGMKMTGVDKIASELHNPEATLPQRGGNVPLNNYKLIAALAVMRKEIGRGDMERFIAARGMPGFSPTQGHIPAAVPYLGHAAEAMAAGKIENALFVTKGSLFLGRMSRLSDGLSFFLQKNNGELDCRAGGRRSARGADQRRNPDDRGSQFCRYIGRSPVGAPRVPHSGT